MSDGRAFVIRQPTLKLLDEMAKRHDVSVERLVALCLVLGMEAIEACEGGVTGTVSPATLIAALAKLRAKP